MQHLEGSGMPVLYIGRTVLKVKAHILGKSAAPIFRAAIRYSLRRPQSKYLLLWQPQIK